MVPESYLLAQALLQFQARHILEKAHTGLFGCENQSPKAMGLV